MPSGALVCSYYPNRVGEISPFLTSQPGSSYVLVYTVAGEAGLGFLPTASHLLRRINGVFAGLFGKQARRMHGVVYRWDLGSLSGRRCQEEHQALTYTGTWPLQATSLASGGYVKYSGTSGAKAKYTFAGRNVAWVAPKGPDRVKAEV